MYIFVRFLTRVLFTITIFNHIVQICEIMFLTSLLWTKVEVSHRLEPLGVSFVVKRHLI